MSFTTPAFGVKVIIDADLNTDPGDAGALALIHNLARKGYCDILATMTSVADGDAAKMMAAINYFYRRSDIPVGYYASNVSVTSEGFVNDIATTFAWKDNAGSLNPGSPVWTDPVTLYRQKLAAAADGSVRIICIGFTKNLSRLLASSADGYSALNGSDLVAAKCEMLVVMGGVYDGTSTGFPNNAEYNFLLDPVSADDVCDNWPSTVPIVFTGYEVGLTIISGGILGRDPTTSPARYAYNALSYLPGGRAAWDETAVLIAVRGLTDSNAVALFSATQGDNVVNSANGANTFTAGAGSHYYVTKVASDAALKLYINRDILIKSLLTEFTYKKKIEYNTTLPGGSHANFPFLLDITTDADIAAELASGGGVTITSADGETEVPFMLYADTNLSAGTVKARAIFQLSGSAADGDTLGWLYYGADAPANNELPFESNGIAIYMPLEEDPSGSSPQFSNWTRFFGLDKTGVSNGSMTSGDLVTGQVSKGIDFDGSNDQIRAATTSEWTAPSGTASRAQRILFKSTSTAGCFLFSYGTFGSLELSTIGIESNKIGAIFDFGATDVREQYTGVYNDGNWHSIGLNYDGTTVRIYADGSEIINATRAMASVATDIYIASNVFGSGNAAHILDEACVLNRSVSAAFWSFWHANEFSNAATFALGAEQPANVTVAAKPLDCVLTNHGIVNGALVI